MSGIHVVFHGTLQGFGGLISGLPGTGSLGLFTLPVNPIYLLGREGEFLHAFSSPRIEILSQLMSVLPGFAFIEATDFWVLCSLKWRDGFFPAVLSGTCLPCREVLPFCYSSLCKAGFPGSFSPLKHLLTYFSSILCALQFALRKLEALVQLSAVWAQVGGMHRKQKWSQCQTHCSANRNQRQAQGFTLTVGCFERLFCLQSFNSVVSLSPFPSIM